MEFGKREPTGFRGVERRNSIRWEANTAAVIVLPDGQNMCCMIRDLSTTGARLELTSTFGLSDPLVIRFSNHRQWVSKAWVSSHSMGVQFV
jgi:hypothetical protein